MAYIQCYVRHDVLLQLACHMGKPLNVKQDNWLFKDYMPTLSNNSKWRLHSSVGYDATSSSPSFHTTIQILMKISKGTHMEAIDHCSVTLIHN